ncbi:lasso peptide biosynthesis B2 protein [Streptomyces sp. NPDC002701]|uniref:lasso peptide biosynthesis B2 protein n=1 Tax=Streptomyces sp. NPDC002701 TaxID=3364661 RepID=UPI0036A0484D
MSLPVLPSRPLRPPLAVRLEIRTAVWVARRLARRSPQRIRAVMTLLSRGVRAADRAQARQARDEVLSVSPRYCGPPAACLPRSIAVALLCRTRGTWPTWCVGVLAAPPFLAHAWVEVAGEMVDEPVDSDCYRKFFAVEPVRGPTDARAASTNSAGHRSGE